MQVNKIFYFVSRRLVFWIALKWPNPNIYKALQGILPIFTKAKKNYIPVCI